jgi:flavin-dependent dehydrogenase
MDTVRILGGGISGLAAAINLRKAGIDTEVYEKKNYCGKHCNDFQFLEDWTFDEHVFDLLKRINIDIDFYTKPYRAIEIMTPFLKNYVGRSDKPFMYLVKRGSSDDSIDRSLERQAKSLGVRIIYNSELTRKEADIVATGPIQPRVVVQGIKFRLDHPDRSVVLFDNNVSQGSYSYLIVNDNVAEIACPNRIEIKDTDARFERCIKFFEKLLDMKVGDIDERFSATANFLDTNTAMTGNQRFVGEAAGFQDCMLGFGMLYAFKSGHLAAQSVINGMDYDELWKKDFQNHMKISYENKKIYRSVSNNAFDNMIKIMNSSNPIIKKMRGSDDMGSILKKIYNGYLLGTKGSLLKRIM